VTPPAPRRAHRSDLAAIASLWRDLIESHAALDPVFAPRADAPERYEREVARWLDDARCAIWVIERDRAPVGFCAARLDRTDSLAAETCRVEITEIAVAPPARRSGCGRALATVALDWARERGAARVEVRVAAGNAAGQAFWRALGFGDFVDVLDRRL
jgi:ribosomal protein S18 acetylase RimI-like enzyme